MYDEDDDTTEEIVSGPYCEHWATPSDCDEVCTCGHKCCRHDNLQYETVCNECDCKKFTLVE